MTRVAVSVETSNDINRTKADLVSGTSQGYVPSELLSWVPVPLEAYKVEFRVEFSSVATKCCSCGIRTRDLSVQAIKAYSSGTTATKTAKCYFFKYFFFAVLCPRLLREGFNPYSSNLRVRKCVVCSSYSVL
jgi:hypothetical protein